MQRRPGSKFDKNKPSAYEVDYNGNDGDDDHDDEDDDDDDDNDEVSFSSQTLLKFRFYDDLFWVFFAAGSM